MSFLTPINGGKECLENHLITQQKTGCYKTGVIQEAQKIDFFQLAHFQKLSEKMHLNNMIAVPLKNARLIYLTIKRDFPFFNMSQELLISILSLQCKWVYQSFYTEITVFSVCPFLRKALGIYTEGFCIRADFLHEGRWQEEHAICKISLVSFASKPPLQNYCLS